MHEQPLLHVVSCIDRGTRSASVRSEASGIAAGTASGGGVGLDDVGHDHAIGAEPPAERPERPLHARDPFPGEAGPLPGLGKGGSVTSRGIRWTPSLPCRSCGWDLPANTTWMGIFGLLTSDANASMS